jgi:hypothetical protein
VAIVKCLSVIKEIKDSNLSIVNDTIQSPKMLAKWLYENQGEMRLVPKIGYS